MRGPWSEDITRTYILMPDNFLSNRVEDVKQLKYLLGHKYNVYKAGRTLDVPRIQLLKHDLRKFSPKEWTPYREFFFDKDGPNKTDIVNFKRAVKHHKTNNPHHQGQAPLESVADWYSAGEPKKIPFKQWVRKNMNTFQLSDKVKEQLLAKTAAGEDRPKNKKIPDGSNLLHPGKYKGIEGGGRFGDALDYLTDKQGPPIRMGLNDALGRSGSVVDTGMHVGRNVASKASKAVKGVAPWLGVATVVGGIATEMIGSALKARVPQRTGAMGKLQQFGAKHNQKFIYKNPELTAAGATAGAGLIGASLLDS